MHAGNTQTRVMVTGLDGVGYGYLNERIAAGDCPQLARIIQQGNIRPLDSTPIILTPVAWSTAYTGVNPGHHGICGFTRQKQKSYQWEFVSPGQRAAREYWRHLSDQGRRSIVVGPIFCQKQEAFNGILVAGEFCGDIRKHIYPETLADQVLNQFQYEASSQWKSLEEADRFLQRKVDLARHLLANHPWDLAQVSFMEPDIFHHRNDAQFCRQAYQLLDRHLGRLWNDLPQDVSHILHSDHGHRMYRRAFHVNSWLYTQGFLQLQPGWRRWQTRMQELRTDLGQIGRNGSTPLSRLFYSGVYAGRTLVRAVPPLHKAFLKAFPNAALPDQARPVALGDMAESLDPGKLLDYSQTQAYAYLNRGGNIAGLCINRHGRCPQGIVQDRDYQAVCQAIVAALNECMEPRTGQPLVKQVWRREELFHGPFSADFPDIVFALDEDYFTYISEDNISRQNVFLDIADSQHALEGMIACSGPLFHSGPIDQQHRATLLDVAPTVLHALGARLPQQLEGQVLLDAFDPQIAADRAVVYDEHTAATPVVANSYDQAEESLIEQRLKDLGYIV